MAEPLSAEYAKSGKAGCKGCGENIAKGTLRVGFVGKANFGATAWYHYECIWKDYENLKDVDGSKSPEAVVQGFGDLNESDMDKLKKDLPKFCKEAVVKFTEKPKETGPSAPIAVEYAKSAKSSCKGCTKTIDKNVLRVGFTGKANFGATAWYHYDCVWKDTDTLKGIDESQPLDKLVSGLEQLGEADKKKLETDLPKYCKEAVQRAANQPKGSGPKEPLAAEYAKSAKSSCKGCSKGIDKGVLRVGLVGKANFGATAWYHFDCIWKDTDSLAAIKGSSPVTDLVSGIDQLRKEDQEKVQDSVQAFCSGKMGSKRKSTGGNEDAAAQKKSK